MQNEIWLDVPGFPGYQVSNAGRVKSFRSGERILKQCNDSYGYPTVVLCGPTGKRTKTIHRLVALAFIPNPDNKPEIDHINTNRMDNRVENLQWVTRKENTHNPLSIQAYKRMTHIHSAVDKRKKPIVQLNGGNVVCEFDCIRDAERSTGISHQNIASVLRGRSFVAGGFGWQYKK